MHSAVLTAVGLSRGTSYQVLLHPHPRKHQASVEAGILGMLCSSSFFAFVLLLTEAREAKGPLQHANPDCPLQPRQFVPPTGQSFTTLAQMRKNGYKNTFQKSDIDDRVFEIATEPSFGIGQRACLLQTPHGNVLWDLIAYLDKETVNKVAQAL
jgi:hypothetical protein